MENPILSRVSQLFSRRHSGIRRRLLIWGLTLLGIALIGNTLAGSIYTRRLIHQKVTELQTEIASRVALEIEEFMRRRVERLLDLSASATLYELGGREQRLLVLLLLKNDRAFTEGSILDGNGMEVLKVSERRVYLPEELVDQSNTDKFKKAIKGENYSSPVYTSDKAEPYVTIAVPLKLTPQEIAGVVSVEANLKILWEVIGDVEFGHAGYAYLVDGRGNVIAHRDPSLVLKRTNLSGLHQIQEFLQNPAGTDPSPGGEDEGILGKRVLSTFAPVRGLGWAVVLEEPVDMALAEVRKVERYALLLLGLGMVVGALIIVWVSSRITRPILQLHHGAEVIGRGNLHHRVKIETGDEIEQLAREFNKMAGELQGSYAMLEQKVEQRTRELSALYDVTTTVSQSLELEPVLEEVIQKIKDVFHFDTMRIYLFDPQMEELHLRVSLPEKRPDLARVMTFRRGQGIVGRVAESGELMIFEDLQNDPRYQELSQTKNTQRTGFKFLAAFPIRSKLKSVGAMVCNGQTPRKLASEEIRLLTSMANQIGVAVENTTLFEETVTRSKELSALYDVAATLSQSLEPDVVLKEVIHKILEVTHFDAARVYLVSPDGKELQLKAYEGISPEFASQMATYSATNGIEGKVVTEGEAVFFEDVQTDPQYAAVARTKTTQKAGFHAFLVVPLKAKEKVIGTMSFLSYKAHKFSAKDITLFTSMVNQIGVAMENARLFEETVKDTQQLSALYNVTATVNQSLDLDRVLQEVIGKITEIFQFDTMRIWIFNEQNELQVRASYPPRREDLSNVRIFRRGQGIIGKVADSGQPMMFEDIQTDPRYRELSDTKNTQRTGFRFFAAFPIKSRLRSVGAIICNSKVARRLTSDEVQLIESMADQIGVAIENANLFYETKQKSVELEEANIELVEANRAKADFLAAMSHELRTPLNVIIGNADLIKDGTFGEISGKQKVAVDKILHYSETLLKLINDVLTLTKVEAKKVSLHLSAFHVDEIITHAQSYVEQLNRNDRLKVLWEVEPNLRPMTTDALKLEEILQNLIGNAFKFTSKGGIEVRVRDLKGKGRIEFSVADTGIGIASGDLGGIFEQFHQLKEAHTGSYSGMGLGLSIVKRYLEMMRGQIRVESQPGKGSTFTFDLPYSIQTLAD